MSEDSDNRGSCIAQHMIKQLVDEIDVDYSGGEFYF